MPLLQDVRCLIDSSHVPKLQEVSLGCSALGPTEFDPFSFCGCRECWCCYHYHARMLHPLRPKSGHQQKKEDHVGRKLHSLHLQPQTDQVLPIEITVDIRAAKPWRSTACALNKPKLDHGLVEQGMARRRGRGSTVLMVSAAIPTGGTWFKFHASDCVQPFRLFAASL